MSDLCVVFTSILYSNLSIDYCTDKIVEFHIIIINIESLFLNKLTKNNLDHLIN